MNIENGFKIILSMKSNHHKVFSNGIFFFFINYFSYFLQIKNSKCLFCVYFVFPIFVSLQIKTSKRLFSSNFLSLYFLNNLLPRFYLDLKFWWHDIFSIIFFFLKVIVHRILWWVRPKSLHSPVSAMDYSTLGFPKSILESSSNLMNWLVTLNKLKNVP